MRTISEQGGGAAGASVPEAPDPAAVGASEGGPGDAHAKVATMSRAAFAVLLALLAALVAGSSLAAPPADDRLRPLIGEPRSVLVRPGETLLDIALHHGAGFDAISRLNPEVDSWIPDPGTVVLLPSPVVLPVVEEQGLVINIPEMRLFDFTLDDGPKILAAAVGDAEDPTPTGEFEIRDKRVDPVWTVPSSIREEKPELPAQVPPGPDNPLGSRWMRIGRTSAGIHGTNTRWSIGRASTHGCVRLYEPAVQDLFERTPEGARLHIVYQPYKWGRDGSRILFEAHPDRYHRIPDPLATALRPIRELGLLDSVDIERVWQAIDESRGIPIRVGTLPPAESP
jgi:L,D-transpeptidase ErfK/SrfK